MRITLDEVRHIAALARLALEPHELAGLQRDMEKILGYVEHLGALDTSGVAPFFPTPHPSLPLRTDTPQPSLDAHVALGEAPRAQEGGFAVPGFMDE